MIILENPVDLIQTLEQEEIARLNKTIPAFAPGDTVIVNVNVVEGCGFADAEGTKQFLTMTQNPTSGDEKGTVICQIVTAAGDTSEWFAVFEYDEVGYVKDDEKGSLDADEILKSLREGNEAGNEMRRERGWGTKLANRRPTTIGRSLLAGGNRGWARIDG